MNKSIELAKIANEIENCMICRKDKSGKAVPGEGNPNADIVFIGEAPGKEESKTGRPFVGRSGKLLRSLIRKIGLKENDVFITSPIKYFPNKGTPTKADIVHGRPYLFKQLAVINPKIVVLLGKVAYESIFQESIPIVSEHGRIIKKDKKTYFLTLHPSAALRSPKFRKIFLNDFNKLKLLINQKA